MAEGASPPAHTVETPTPGDTPWSTWTRKNRRNRCQADACGKANVMRAWFCAHCGISLWYEVPNWTEAATM